MLERQVGNYIMLSYPTGDFLIRIKNASLANQKTLTVKETKEKTAIANCLKKAGFLDDVTKKAGELILVMKFSHKEPTILGITLVSKPGRRVYLKVDDLAAKKGSSIYVVSTPKGVLSSKEAIKAGVGGEVIAEVW